MKGIRYTAEFKAEAIKQMTEHGFGTVEMANGLSLTIKAYTAEIGH